VDIQVPHPKTAWTSTIDKFPAEGDDPPDHALTETTWISTIDEFPGDDPPNHTLITQESHNILFNEGGPAPSFYQAILEPGRVDGAVNQGPDNIPVVPNIVPATEQPKQMTEEYPNVVSGQIFLDPCGKQPTRSHHGYKYLAAFIDNKSRRVSVSVGEVWFQTDTNSV
jgi:hypothetical protein